MTHPVPARVVGGVAEDEHVAPRGAVKRAVFRAADASGAWPALAGGCHLARDTGAAIAAAGFAVEACERIEFRSVPLEPRLPYVLGRARSTG
jgi:hypothetical protein